MRLGREKMNEEKVAIILRAPCCGHIIFAAVDEPGVLTRKDTNYIGRMVAKGFKAERISVVEVRAAKWGCECGKKMER